MFISIIKLLPPGFPRIILLLVHLIPPFAMNLLFPGIYYVEWLKLVKDLFKKKRFYEIKMKKYQIRNIPAADPWWPWLPEGKKYQDNQSCGHNKIINGNWGMGGVVLILNMLKYLLN